MGFKLKWLRFCTFLHFHLLSSPTIIEKHNLEIVHVSPAALNISKYWNLSLRIPRNQFVLRFSCCRQNTCAGALHSTTFRFECSGDFPLSSSISYITHKMTKVLRLQTEKPSGEQIIYCAHDSVLDDGKSDCFFTATFRLKYKQELFGYWAHTQEADAHLQYCYATELG